MDIENKTKLQLYLKRVEQLYISIQLSIKTTTGKWLAFIKPNGASVIGGEGLIEIEGLLAGKEYLLYMRNSKKGASLYKGINQDGWYWIEDSRRNRAHLLDKSLLLDIITLVSDYEF